MPRINTAIRSVWGVSEIGFSIAATLETTFFLFFLTDVAQLPLAISGIIATGASAVDTSHNTHVSGTIPACEASPQPPYRAACEHSRHLVTGFKADPLVDSSPRLALAPRGGFPQAQGCGPCARSLRAYGFIVLPSSQGRKKPRRGEAWTFFALIPRDVPAIFEHPRLVELIESVEKMK